MLDPAGRIHILELARELWQQGTTVLWVTQRPEELAESPRVAVMEEGILRFDGDPRTLFYSSGLPELLELGAAAGCPHRPAAAVTRLAAQLAAA